jgi:hypothetical protein
MRFMLASHRPNKHKVVRRDADFKIQAAASLAAGGHEVWMLYNGPLSERERALHEVPGVRYLERDGDLARPASIAGLMRQILRLRIDATLSQWEATYTLSVAALLCGVRRRWVRVNSFPWLGRTPSRSSLRRNRLLFRLLAPDVVTCSAALTRDVATKFGLAEQRVHTVHPGIRRIEPATLPATPGAQQVVLTVAVLEPHKGHSDLLRAIQQVASRHPQALFRFVGGGALRESLER